MKSLKTISLTTIGTLAILGTSAFASTGLIKAPNGLILRKEAAKSGEVITTIPNNTQVNVIEKDGEWYKTEYNNQQGYVFGEYVELTEELVEQKPEEQIPVQNENLLGTQTTTQNNLKVHIIPVITSTIISEIPENTLITIEKQITNWSYISAGQVKGWVRTYGISNTVQESTTETNTEISNEEIPETEETEIEENEPTAQPSNQEQVEQAIDEVKGFVAVDYANVREKASTDSKIVTTLTQNTSFTINAETEEWYKIKYVSPSGVVYEGYIFKELVTK